MVLIVSHPRSHGIRASHFLQSRRVSRKRIRKRTEEIHTTIVVTVFSIQPVVLRLLSPYRAYPPPVSHHQDQEYLLRQFTSDSAGEFVNLHWHACKKLLPILRDYYYYTIIMYDSIWSPADGSNATLGFGLRGTNLGLLFPITIADSFPESRLVLINHQPLTGKRTICALWCAFFICKFLSLIYLFLSCYFVDRYYLSGRPRLWSR